MTLRYLALSVSLTALAAAAPALSLDAFKDSTLPMPSLSLPDSVTALPAKPADSEANRKRVDAIGRRMFEVKHEGGMPVLTPNPNVDYKLIVKVGNPAIDPKMLFPTEVASAK